MPRFFPLIVTSFAAASLLSAGRAEVSPGEILISEMNCAACHEPAEEVGKRLASRRSPVLGTKGSRLTPQWIRAFLENPQATQPGTLMPDTLHALPPAEKAEAADALTHFLLSLQSPAPAADHAATDTLMAAGKRLYHETGCVMCHAPAELPASSAADAAAQEEFERLRQVSVPLGDLARKFTVAALSDFLRDPLETRPSGRMPAMLLDQTEADAVATWLLREQAAGGASSQMTPLGHTSFAPDPAKAARGKELFAQMNCAGCHAGSDVAGRKARPFAELRSRQPAGCISPVAKPGVPRFELTDRQRVVIQSALGSQEVLDVPLEPAQQIRRTLTVLNCYACHSRDRRGGVDGMRRDFLTTIGGIDLGDEGRIPPALTGIGAKLRPEELRRVLVEGGNPRPHMATRMSLFGEANVGHLPALLDTVDSPPEAAAEPAATDETEAELGRKLIGTGGLACINCHSFDGAKSLGTPGLDLATTSQRLKWDWFRRFLRDPQVLRPGTRMPTIWPAAEIASGEAEKQIQAIWAYLSRKNFSDLPDGLPAKER